MIIIGLNSYPKALFHFHQWVCVTYWTLMLVTLRLSRVKSSGFLASSGRSTSHSQRSCAFRVGLCGNHSWGCGTVDKEMIFCRSKSVLLGLVCVRLWVSAYTSYYHSLPEAPLQKWVCSSQYHPLKGHRTVLIWTHTTTGCLKFPRDLYLSMILICWHSLN